MLSLQTPAAVNGVASALMTPKAPLIVTKSFPFIIETCFFVVFFFLFFWSVQRCNYNARREKPDSFSTNPLLYQTIDIMVCPVSPGTAGSNQHLSSTK